MTPICVLPPCILLLTLVCYNMDKSTKKENPMERSEYKQIAEVLGGQKVFGRSRWSSLWWTMQIEKGLPFAALESIKDDFRLTDREISVALDVSTKTASRW